MEEEDEEEAERSEEQTSAEDQVEAIGGWKVSEASEQEKLELMYGREWE